MHSHAPTAMGYLDSHWKERHPGEKLLGSLAWLALALALPPIPWAPVVLACITAVALAQARIRPGLWMAALTAPTVFAVFALLPLLWNASFAFREASVYEAPLRSIAGAAAVLLVGLTTPVPDLLALGRRAGIPAPMVDLVFLMYRFAIAAAAVLAGMMRAMSLRAPRASWRRQIRAAAWLASSLYARILARALRSESGLAARGVDGYVVPPFPTSRFSVPQAALLLCGPVAIGLCAALCEVSR
jgi:cobalt/nickel transport system permease protein